MKYIFYILVIPALLSSCKKNAEVIIIPAVSLNFSNVSPGIDNAFVKDVYAGSYSDLIGVPTGMSALYTLPAGTSKIDIAATDTIKLLNTTEIKGSGGTIYSMFLAGDAGNDILLTKDSIPSYSDSSFGVRFINLSSGSDPINVNIQGAMQLETTGLAYKYLTGFLKYPAGGDFINTGYVFEFRDAATDSLLVTYSTANKFYPPIPVFNNITLVLYGPPGNQQVAEVNNF